MFVCIEWSGGWYSRNGSTEAGSGDLEIEEIRVGSSGSQREVESGT